eukprot:CAMPEP_0114246638 /NCGR_PEP_ID=MMETSP0058-20121206/12581_1 /TAXON_ID=36894 /ORGANISM="Pyramimonas parkeae, CCMP726" /LENGTH=128 /DNA_ID=CAMNT_0001359861 /DNA_START=632 /DNA_END=1018 /DNA_ORIENTATION=-
MSLELHDQVQNKNLQKAIPPGTANTTMCDEGEHAFVQQWLMSSATPKNMLPVDDPFTDALEQEEELSQDTSNSLRDRDSKTFSVFSMATHNSLITDNAMASAHSLNVSTMDGHSATPSNVLGKSSVKT